MPSRLGADRDGREAPIAARLSRQDVQEIRLAGTRMAARSGASISDQCKILAPVYGVTESTIYDVLAGLSWRRYL